MDLVLVISEKGNWKRSISVMDRNHLGIFIFLNNIPDVEDTLLSVAMLRGGAGAWVGRTNKNKL